MPDAHDVLLPHRRVLVVEDSYLVAQEIMEALERQGATVIGPVSTLHDALRLARETSELDAAVLDVNIRGEMIWPVADFLSGRGVKIVFATGYPAEHIKERYSQSNVIEKPIPARAIARMLAS